MSKRERTLAIVIGVLGALAVLNFVGKQVWSAYQSRQDELAQLTEEIESKELVIARGKRARRILDVLETRGLPDNMHTASTLYREWLDQWVSTAGFSQHEIQYISGQTFKDSYRKWTFSVTCEGDLDQFTRLLHEFYVADHLHRIQQLSVRPNKENRLVMAFTIQAVSLPNVAKTELTSDLSERLAHQSLDDYKKILVDRNIFGPGNKAPEFSSMRPVSSFVNEEFTYRPRVSDPERDDLQFEFGEGELPEGITIDPASGTIVFTPSAKGDYRIPIKVTDQGMPARSATEVLELTVTDPPPPEDPAPERPRFDIARYTFLTGIIQQEGRPGQAWLTSRTEGRVIKVFEGDEIEVGLFAGKLEKVARKYIDVTVEGGDRIRIDYGRALTDGQVVGEGVSLSRQD